MAKAWQAGPKGAIKSLRGEIALGQKLATLTPGVGWHSRNGQLHSHISAQHAYLIKAVLQEEYGIPSGIVGGVLTVSLRNRDKITRATPAFETHQELNIAARRYAGEPINEVAAEMVATPPAEAEAAPAIEPLIDAALADKLKHYTKVSWALNTDNSSSSFGQFVTPLVSKRIAEREQQLCRVKGLVTQLSDAYGHYYLMVEPAIAQAFVAKRMARSGGADARINHGNDETHTR